MNLLKSILTPKGFGIMALVLVALGAILWLQTERLSVSNAKIDVLTKSTADLRGMLDGYVTAVKARDATITQQTDSITALENAAKADRSRYLALLEEARKTAAVQKNIAGELMALKAPEGELAQCRAARDLLAGELTQ